jgi:RNA polymerase-associated protein LEO1
MMYEPDAHAVADQDPQLALLDQDAEMDDLFGNDEECVILRVVYHSYSYTSPYSRGAASDAQSGVDSDRLPSPERERRQALEYEEDEEPGQIAVIVREANVAFPNIPVPKTSNGEVCFPTHLAFIPIE